MLIDIAIVLVAIVALYRGRELGFVRQAFSTAGFIGGLFVGALLEPHAINLVHTQAARAVMAATTSLGCALLLLMLGEYLGIRLKYRVRFQRINRLDNVLGSVLAIFTWLFAVWLLAAIINASPFPNIQSALRQSRIISSLSQRLPEAPTLIGDLGHLIDPNGFPQVFIGSEPNPPSNIKLPTLGDLQAAVKADEASVVKVEGQGCGGTVEGSGFIVANGLVATNAHVVAGIAQPYIVDDKGVHRATAVWFDPNLDFAVLRVSNLAGSALNISAQRSSTGTPAAIMGYPGGGALTAGTAAILDEFTAEGRNIYDRGKTLRDVYEIRADVIPGNSGGPLVATDGSVIGVVFAESTSYQHVGYALTSPAVIGAIHQATSQNQAVSTGQCAN